MTIVHHIHLPHVYLDVTEKDLISADNEFVRVLGNLGFSDVVGFSGDIGGVVYRLPKCGDYSTIVRYGALNGRESFSGVVGFGENEKSLIVPIFKKAREIYRGLTFEIIEFDGIEREIWEKVLERRVDHLDLSGEFVKKLREIVN